MPPQTAKPQVLQGADLAPFGFYHVTGLPSYVECGEQSHFLPGNLPCRKDAGTFWRDHNAAIAVMRNGEVWIAAAPETDPGLNMLISSWGFSSGDFIPWRDGYVISWQHLDWRRRDPLENFSGQYSPEPKFKD